MSGFPRLTLPQRTLLLRIHEQGPQSVCQDYSPAKALVGHGLAEWKHGKMQTRLALTEKGTEIAREMKP